MLGEQKLKLFRELVTTSTQEELIWMSGYIAALTSGSGIATLSKEAAVGIASVAAKSGVNKITIAYGTETGNAKKLATDFAAKAKKAGVNAKIVGLDQYRLNDLTKEEYFFTVISTQGEGEPPAAALKFYNHIHQNGLKLDKLKFGVLALGDTSYPLFCKAGEDVDAQFQKLGGESIVPLQKCDVDYEAQAIAWFESVLQALSGKTTATTSAVAAKPAGKKNYEGTIVTNINLNDDGSNKATHHIEIVAEGLEYQPGDSLGMVPYNNAAIVKSILSFSGADAAKTVTYKDQPISIGDLLLKKVGIVYLPERVVAKYAAIVGKEIAAKRTDLLDLLKFHPLKNAAQFEEVIQILEPIAPRLYSIASSLQATDGEVHITVAKNTFKVNGETKSGLASSYLSALPTDTTLDFYIHKNNQFRLPEEDKNVIMVGPGTGIAPFRSFLAERDAVGASGKNWLFFGEQHFTTDFLYQTDIQNWYQTGVLSKVSLAFSRDQQEKIYVQHRMAQEGAQLFDWLQQGAYLYVCGAKDPMSVDVENTLLQIVQQYGKLSAEEAEEYLLQLKDEGRYLKDVY